MSLTAVRDGVLSRSSSIDCTRSQLILSLHPAGVGISPEISYFSRLSIDPLRKRFKLMSILSVGVEFQLGLSPKHCLKQRVPRIRCASFVEIEFDVTSISTGGMAGWNEKSCNANVYIRILLAVHAVASLMLARSQNARVCGTIACANGSYC